MSSSVLLPTFPFPIFLLPILVTGTIRLILWVAKISDFFLSSSSLIVLNFILNGEFFRIISRVIPGRTPSLRVQSVLPSNQNMFA